MFEISLSSYKRSCQWISLIFVTLSLCSFIYWRHSFFVSLDLQLLYVIKYLFLFNPYILYKSWSILIKFRRVLQEIYIGLKVNRQNHYIMLSFYWQCIISWYLFRSVGEVLCFEKHGFSTIALFFFIKDTYSCKQ